METIKKIVEKIEEMNLYQKENGFTQEFLDRQVCKFAHSTTILNDLKEFIERSF